MGGTGVIDRFLEVFTRYIDCGFGLLGGEVAFLATTLAAIDITLAALFWSWGGGRGHHRAAGQEDAVRRRLRLPHRQLEQSRPHHLRELFRAWPEGVRIESVGRRLPAPRPRRAGRARRRPADPRIRSPA